MILEKNILEQNFDMAPYKCTHCGSKSESLFCEMCGNLIVKPELLQKQSLKEIKNSFFFTEKSYKYLQGAYFQILSDKERTKINEAHFKAIKFQSNPELGVEEFLKNPTLWYNWYGLGELRIYQGKIEQSILAKKRCFQLRPSLKLVLFEIGLGYLILKRYELALESFLACKDDLSKFLLVHTNLAETYIYLEKYDMAISVVSEVIANKRHFLLSKKKVKEIWLWIAIQFLKNPVYFNKKGNDYSELIRVLDCCLQIDSENQHAWRMKLRIDLELHRYQSVIDFCKENLHKYAKNYYFWAYYAIALFETEEMGKSNLILLEILTSFPNESDFILRIALNYYKLKEFEKAIKFFERYLKIDHKSITALSYLAVSYIKIKNYDAAIQASKKMIESEKDNSIGWNCLALSLQKNNEFEEALTTYKKALECNPEDHEASSNLASLFNVMGNYSKAIEFANKTLSIVPGYYPALNHLGYAYYKKGEFNKANSYLDKSIDSNDQYPASWLNKARIFSETNQYDKALEYCNKSLELDPTFDKALEFKRQLEEKN